jgi:hypothetical protein
MNGTSNRRLFLHRSLKMALTVTGSALLMHCAKQKATVTAKTASPSKEPCSDLTGVNPADVAKRKSLGYTSQSPQPDSQCDNCKLWVPAKEGEECGGCLLFTGPVSPGGHCTYWAPQV